MTDKKYLTNADVHQKAYFTARCILHFISAGHTIPPGSEEEVFMHEMKANLEKGSLTVFGIPRGGIPAAYAILAALNDLSPKIRFLMVENPEEANIFLDDIVDSGETRRNYLLKYLGRLFYALIDQSEEQERQWIVFPWEKAENGTLETAEDNVRRIIQSIGENSNREGLLETPKRVVKALEHWYEGYSQNPKEILKVFKDGSENYDQMVLVKDFPFYSHCEHHMAPIFGTATIAYIPDGRIVGLSKLPKLFDCFAHRMQVQERLTNQVADALFENLKPKGVGVLVKARHLCMESRGYHQQGHHTVTSALRGVLLENPAARAEFMQLAG